MNNANQLTTVSSSPNTTFTYDNNGDTATKVDGTGTTTYTWNSQNQLTQVSLPGGATVTFKYDPFGRRVQKTSASGTINYLYDGPNAIEEIDSAGNVVAKYAQSLSVDQPLAILRGSTSYYEADGLGSVTSLTDSTGNIASSYTYETFGKLSASSGTVNNALRHTARGFDGEAGLYYYRARYYSPDIGRFRSEDPIRFTGGMNFYEYVANRPAIYVDPYGLWPITGLKLGPSPDVISEAIALERLHFGNAYDPYDGAYRHCVASCLLRQHYWILGNLAVWIHDQVNEKPTDYDHDTDLAGEQAGLRCAKASGTCGDKCLKIYPAPAPKWIAPWDRPKVKPTTGGGGW